MKQATSATAGHYQFLGLVGLALTFYAQSREPRVGVLDPVFANVGYALCAIVGAVGLLLKRPRGPLLYLMLVVGVCMLTGYRTGRLSRATLTMFDPSATMLTAGVLLYLTAAYRAQSMRVQVLPEAPRLEPEFLPKDGPPPLAETRPPAPPEELVGYVLCLPLCVLAGQAIWILLLERAPPDDLPAGFGRIAVVVWFTLVGGLTLRFLTAFWRRRGDSPETARLYLQEQVWHEARRDHRRVASWLAWARRRK